VNATLNGVSSVLLIAGYRAVRRRNYALHVRLMLSALLSSALFFVSYVTYHHFHGDTKFAGHGLVRPVYFFILISHIVLSAVAVPMILTSFYLALAGRLPTHKRVSRITFPVWLYVSVTGVVIFAMLKLFS
jgi:putative membrane protein